PLDVPPPGAGLKTVTVAFPPVAISDAKIPAVSVALLIKLVVREVPFHLTMELFKKFAPATVMVKAAPPAVAELGMMLDNVGAGFGEALMVKTFAAEVPPGAGLRTVTVAVPVEAISVAAIEAVSSP